MMTLYIFCSSRIIVRKAEAVYSWNSRFKSQSDVFCALCFSNQDLESELNLHYDELITEKSRDYLLSNQLQRLLMCFDVFLETKGEGQGLEGPTEFAREKMFIRLTR